MKCFGFYLLVSLIAHVIGVGGVLFANFLTGIATIPTELAEVKEEFDVTPLVTIEQAKRHSLQSLPRFLPAGRGCGNGYVQAYETNGGQGLSEGVQVFRNSKETRARLNEWIRKGARIVERVPNHKNRWGEPGDRIILIHPPDEDGPETVGIYWYGGGDSITFIYAQPWIWR